MPHDFPSSETFDALAARLGKLFSRSETRLRAIGYLKGLLSPCERKNSWQLAEWLGDATPDGVQYLLERGRWDPDAARDELQRWVADHLGAEDGIFIVDETGFIKKGQHSAGVQRPRSSGEQSLLPTEESVRKFSRFKTLPLYFLVARSAT